MPPRAERIVGRARALVGVRFRPQGRSAATGLDCVGLAALAAGISAPRPDYALRGGSAEQLAGELRAAGLREVAGPRPGDLFAMTSGPGQLHLGIFTGTGLVHCDSVLRRVVERPCPTPWPILSIWRFEEE
jgi:cell wall-associated NlpC family hydrolase